MQNNAVELMPENKPTVLILGGYGNFGSRLATLLAQDSTLNIIIAGRNQHKAQTLARSICQHYPAACVQGIVLDWQQDNFEEELKKTHSQIVIHTAGPFQGQNYRVANTCINLKMHYLDLSDGREFVTHIEELDEKAKKNDVVILSGASSVPGISSVVIAHYAKKFGILREIEFGIAPANKIQRGDALIQAILGYTGKPFLRLEKGKWVTVYGWQSIHRHYYGDNLGLRWHANCDIPDLVLLPQKYPMLNSVIFYAGLEVPLLHLGLWGLSWLSRAKIIRNWTYFYKTIASMSRWFKGQGTDAGGMYIRLAGSSHRYQPLVINWILVAEKGHGPFLPIIPCLILVKKILHGEIPPGAKPCFEMFSLEEFEESIAKWSIYTTLEETES